LDTVAPDQRQSAHAATGRDVSFSTSIYAAGPSTTRSARSASSTMGESMRHSRSWISIAFAAALFVQPLAASAETQTQSSSPDRTPNLVVGIVVDQMRLDTLYRFWHRFGDDGFRKLFDE